MIKGMQVLGVEGGCFRFYRPQLVLYCQYSPSCGQYSGFWSLYWNYNCEISFDVALNRAVIIIIALHKILYGIGRDRYVHIHGVVSFPARFFNFRENYTQRGRPTFCMTGANTKRGRATFCMTGACCAANPKIRNG